MRSRFMELSNLLLDSARRTRIEVTQSDINFISDSGVDSVAITPHDLVDFVNEQRNAFLGFILREDKKRDLSELKTVLKIIRNNSRRLLEIQL